jgi:hypothetical protein
VSGWIAQQAIERKKEAKYQLRREIVNTVILAMGRHRLCPKEIRSVLAAAHRSPEWRDPKLRRERWRNLQIDRSPARGKYVQR